MGFLSLAVFFIIENRTEAPLIDLNIFKSSMFSLGILCGLISFVAINALVRNIGSFAGVAAATTILYDKMSEKLGYRVIDYVEGRDDVFIYGMRYVYIVLAILCLIGELITSYRIYHNKKIKNK